MAAASKPQRIYKLLSTYPLTESCSKPMLPIARLEIHMQELNLSKLNSQQKTKGPKALF